MEKEDFQSGELDGVATSMYIDKGYKFQQVKVRRRIVTAFQYRMEQALNDGLRVIIDSLHQSDWLADCTVEIQGSHERVRGKYLGLDARGRVRLKDQNGKEWKFWAGDVVKVIGK